MPTSLQSGKSNLRDVAAFLLRQECKELPELSTCKNALGMLARTEDVSVQRQIRKQVKLIGESRGALQQGTVETIQVQPSPVAMALEEITTARIAATDLQGWIYIGKADASGTLRDDRTINVPKKPAPNFDVTTSTSVYLRSQGTIRSGSSLGIIPRGQVLRIDALSSRPLAGGMEAVWAKVKPQKGSVQSLP